LSRSPKKTPAPGFRRVAAVGHVQRLVEVAHQMHDPFEGLVALPGPRPLVAEDFDLPGELREAHRPLRQYFA